ncbi:M23 family metallopeptidase [Thermodesulfatator atlanticus]
MLRFARNDHVCFVFPVITFVFFLFVFAKEGLSLSFLPEKPFPGTPVLVSLPTKAEKLIFLGKDFYAFAYQGKYYALVAVPLGVKPGTYTLKIYGEKITSTKIKIYPKKYPTEHLKVPPKMIHYPQEVIDRIKREVKAIKTTLSGFTPKPLFDGPFVWPAAGRLSSPFGFRRIYNDVPKSPHSGIDIAVPSGTPVKAANSGRVVLCGSFYLPGKILIIDHGLGIYTVYCHLSKILVKEGDFVDKGQKIALSGKSGRVTGPHLHFGVYVRGVKVDPKVLLEVF